MACLSDYFVCFQFVSKYWQKLSPHRSHFGEELWYFVLWKMDYTAMFCENQLICFKNVQLHELSKRFRVIFIMGWCCLHTRRSSTK